MLILNCCFNVIIPKFNAVYIYLYRVLLYSIFLFWVFGIWGKESDVVVCYKVIGAALETMNFHIFCTRSKDIVLKKIMRSDSKMYRSFYQIASSQNLKSQLPVSWNKSRI